MSSQLWENLSYVIFFAAIAGIIKFKKIHASYRPFIYFVWWAALNEIISTIAIHLWKSNAINSNIYVLFEFILIVWLFKKWSERRYAKWFFEILLGFGILFWIFDDCIINSIKNFNSLFRVFYSFVIVYLSIEEINTILFLRERKIFKNARFIISLIFIIYFTYKAIFEVFFYIDFNMTTVFYIRLYNVLIIVNLFSNVFYGIATLCIPRKQKFTLQY